MISTNSWSIRYDSSRIISIIITIRISTILEKKSWIFQGLHIDNLFSYHFISLIEYFLSKLRIIHITLKMSCSSKGHDIVYTQSVHCYSVGQHVYEWIIPVCMSFYFLFSFSTSLLPIVFFFFTFQTTVAIGHKKRNRRRKISLGQHYHCRHFAFFINSPLKERRSMYKKKREGRRSGTIFVR